MAVDLTGPITLEVDVPITRRLKLHAVVNGAGEQVFHSRRISEVFGFLAEHGLNEFTMLDEDAEFRVHIKPALSSNPNLKG
jgi:hypothetical protein